MENLVRREGIYYKKFTDVPFTGEVEGSNQGKFKKGKKEGSWKIYNINGQLFFKGDFKNGKKEGSWKNFYSNGQLMVKRDYKNGRIHGCIFSNSSKEAFCAIQ